MMKGSEFKFLEETKNSEFGKNIGYGSKKLKNTRREFGKKNSNSELMSSIFLSIQFQISL